MRKILDFLFKKKAKVSKPPVKRRYIKKKYLVTFEATENKNGLRETHTVVIKSNLEEFIRNMQEANYKFSINFVTRL